MTEGEVKGHFLFFSLSPLPGDRPTTALTRDTSRPIERIHPPVSAFHGDTYKEMESYARKGYL